MKLHIYLEQLLGGAAPIRVLRTLIQYKGKTFTIRGLARDASVSHPCASGTVEKLEKFGIVQTQTVGRSHQVLLNEQSYILKKIIEPMLAAEEQTFVQAVSTLKKHLGTKKIISAAVFGSAARGQEKEDSDIDVLIISNDYEHAIAAVSDAGQEAFAKFHCDTSPLIFSESELKSKKKSDLVRSILNDHVLICGKSLESVLE